MEQNTYLCNQFCLKVFRMRTSRTICAAMFLALAGTAAAGGLLTNTNQNVAFLRNPARDAVIAIDGVYSNPAGVAFLGESHHLSLNWQFAYQSRTIDNQYPLFANNTNDHTTTREFEGTAVAPVVPSIQYAYNKGRLSFQANLSVTGGGGKCTFDNGLGSFEKIVAETAAGACGLASAIDGTLSQLAGTPMQLFTADSRFGSKGEYSYDSYMRGRQYYYGLSVGAAYKATNNLSVFAGVRAVYALCNYYGYVENIKVGNIPLYSVLDASKSDAADIELNCDQSGLGFTPMLGIDYKVGRFNFAAKYEFKTRIRLKNEAVNHTPSIGNLPSNLLASMTSGGMSEASAKAVLGSETVTGAMTSLKGQFDAKMEEAIGEYEDGKSIAADIPSLLTVGVDYTPIDQLHLSAGFHYFDDKHATVYNNHQDKLDRGTIEFNAGVEYTVCKPLTVSAGWQTTNYGITDEYMDDKSFVVSSNSLGVGVLVRLSKRMSLNAAYFHTFYKHKKTNEAVAQNINYTADYTRNNNVFGLGLDVDF